MESFASVLKLKLPYMVGGAVALVSAVLQSFVFNGVLSMLAKSLALGALWVAISIGTLTILKRYLPELYKLGVPEKEGGENNAFDEDNNSEAEKGNSVDLTIGDDPMNIEDFEFEDKASVQSPSEGGASGRSESPSQHKVLDELAQEDSKTIAKAVRHVMNEND